MKDFIKKYKEKNLVHNLSIIGVSFILALMIHFSIGDSSISKSLKSSVLDAAESTQNTWDIYLSLINNGESLSLRSDKDLNQILKLSFSLSYSPDWVKLTSIKANDSTATVQNIANESGFQTAFFIFPTARDIKKWDILGTIQVEKISNKVEYVNLLSVNAEDSSKNIQELSSSWIDF